jgi:hypothetical protein
MQFQTQFLLYTTTDSTGKASRYNSFYKTYEVYLFFIVKNIVNTKIGLGNAHPTVCSTFYSGLPTIRIPMPLNYHGWYFHALVTR